VQDARLLAGQNPPGLIVVVVVDRGRPSTVLPGTQVLRMAVPAHCQDDPALARVIDEAAADMFLRGLAGRSVAQCLPAQQREPPVVVPGHRTGDRLTDGPHPHPLVTDPDQPCTARSSWTRWCVSLRTLIRMSVLISHRDVSESLIEMSVNLSLRCQRRRVVGSRSACHRASASGETRAYRARDVIEVCPL
jgi:hypothetical protein